MRADEQLKVVRALKKALRPAGSPDMDPKNSLFAVCKLFGVGAGNTTHYLGVAKQFRLWLESQGDRSRTSPEISYECFRRFDSRKELARIVGSRNLVYHELAVVIYCMRDAFVQFLVEERWARKGEATDLNRLQDHVLTQLTSLAMKASLRGRAFYLVLYGFIRFSTPFAF